MTMIVPSAVLMAGMTFGAPAAPRQTAFSPESGQLVEAAKGVRAKLEQSVALFGARAETLAELRSVVDECREPDWDGYGAAAIDPASVKVAERIIRALPGGVAMPEVTPEPDGHIALDWMASRHRILSVSASPNGRLAVAWLNGSNRGHMVERFDGERIPAKILTLIEEVTRA